MIFPWIKKKQKADVCDTIIAAVHHNGQILGHYKASCWEDVLRYLNKRAVKPVPAKFKTYDVLDLTFGRVSSVKKPLIFRVEGKGLIKGRHLIGYFKSYDIKTMTDYCFSHDLCLDLIFDIVEVVKI